MENHISKNILLVDDDRMFLTLLASELRDCSSNFHILTAESGEEALKVLGSAPVDLIVTDLKMPEVNGIDLLWHMKTKYPKIQAMVMSTFLDPELETSLWALGASQCIDKLHLNVSVLEEMFMESLTKKMRDQEEKDPDTSNTSNQIPKGRGKRCPFIQKPFEDCYCLDLNSLNIKRTMYYCGGNFEQCEIYKKVNPDQTSSLSNGQGKE